MTNSLTSFINVETDRGNRYVFDNKKEKTLLCHPILYRLISLHRQGGEEAVENAMADEEQRRQLDYYYRKYLYLKAHGFFGREEDHGRLGLRLTARDVEKQLANLKQITFEVTDACNMKCRYCGYGDFYNDYDPRENKTISTGAAKNLLRYVQRLWNSPLNLSYDSTLYLSFYGGEPLLNMTFIREIVDFVTAMDAPRGRFCFSMTTNGLLLEKHMDYLVEKGFRLLISLDGNRENNSYRVLLNGKPGYDHVVKNVELLKARYPEFFKTNVNFNAVFHNRSSVSQLYRYFKEKFDKIPSIGELNNSGVREDKKEEFWAAYANVRQDLFRSEDYSLLEREMFINLPNVRSTAMFLDQYGGGTFRTYRDLLKADTRSKANTRRTPTGTCYPFARRIFVSVNGKLLPCERISQEFTLGRVDEQSVSLDYQAIADMYNNYFDKVRKMCSRCYNREACTQCIFNLDIAGDNPSCPGYMNDRSFTRHFSQYLSYLEANPEIYNRLYREVIIE